jgi:L,D-peptidoglycan transpeptidase YkuD (ErfK/YbiS/YcfS/YnhG family)
MDSSISSNPQKMEETSADKLSDYSYGKSLGGRRPAAEETLCALHGQGEHAGLTEQSRGTVFARQFFVIATAWLLLTCSPTAGGAQADESVVSTPKQSQYRIAIHCARKVLQLWRHAELIKEYPIEVGKTGIHKQHSGDHRTPIGDYEISWMASRNSEKGRRVVDNKSWCIGNQFVYAPSGPRLEKLWADSYGGPQATIISLNYPNAKDRKRGYTGECIHIHASLKIKDGALKKSYGCIHMFAADAAELYEIVDVGAPVKILP